jgi:hypothetical protein
MIEKFFWRLPAPSRALADDLAFILDFSKIIIFWKILRRYMIEFRKSLLTDPRRLVELPLGPNLIGLG